MIGFPTLSVECMYIIVCYCFRVVIKNERYELWKDTIMKMKRLFINYKDKVLRNEERAANPSLPKATNSSAAQGNYLEVLNMSLNGE